MPVEIDDIVTDNPNSGQFTLTLQLTVGSGGGDDPLAASARSAESEVAVPRASVPGPIRFAVLLCWNPEHFRLPNVPPGWEPFALKRGLPLAGVRREISYEIKIPAPESHPFPGMIQIESGVRRRILCLALLGDAIYRGRAIRRIWHGPRPPKKNKKTRKKKGG